MRHETLMTLKCDELVEGFPSLQSIDCSKPRTFPVLTVMDIVNHTQLGRRKFGDVHKLQQD